MTQSSSDKQQSAFSRWLRTGRLPSATTSVEVELKFNPWHDPEDGRFTFAGSGRYYGAGGARPVRHATKNPGRADLKKPPAATGQHTKQPARSGEKPQDHRASGGQLNPTIEFVGGVGEGLYGVAEGTIATVRSALTTNPVTTARNIGRGIARTIDKAIAAEDTPARVQVSRAADAVAHASPREIGRATGSVAGNVALAAVPGAALSKVSSLRRLSGATPGPSYDLPEIGWVKENLGPDTPAKRYNDSAEGARPGQAPTLMRTMPDGSKRPVKFDGVRGEYLNDRKLKIVDAPNARAQVLRHSEVLAQHRLIGTWEVPNEKQKIAALKLLRKMKVTNIKVRVVKP